MCWDVLLKVVGQINVSLGPRAKEFPSLQHRSASEDLGPNLVSSRPVTAVKSDGCWKPRCWRKKKHRFETERESVLWWVLNIVEGGDIGCCKSLKMEETL